MHDRFIKKVVSLRGLRFSLTVSVALAAIIASLAGCHSRAKLPTLPIYSERSVSLRFPRPLTIETPAGDPQTVEEYVRCGLFFFEQERYAEAADAFGKAGARITDHRNPIHRSCLVSKAVCHLLMNDRTAFIKTLDRIKSTYNQYELMVIARRDRRMGALFGLYDEFVKNGID